MERALRNAFALGLLLVGGSALLSSCGQGPGAEAAGSGVASGTGVGGGGASSTGMAAGGEGGVFTPADLPDYLNIVPPGQDGVLNGTEALAAQLGQFPPHVLDQLGMYHDLILASPNIAEEDLLKHYKDASIGVVEGGVEREYSPMAGVVVRRDKAFGVPHIVGETRYATMFAQGYTGAEDRLFLMDLLRHYGRARVSEFLGASEANQAMDRSQFVTAPYKEADLTAQIEELAASGPEGAAVVADIQAYTDGVNAYITEALLNVLKLPAEYAALQLLPLQWKLEDAVAIGALIGGELGKGGGAELVNHCGLKKMKETLGSAAKAREVFDDLHFADDQEAPTTSRTPAPYMQKPAVVDASAHPDIDCATLEAIEGGLLPLPDILGGLGLGGLGLGGLFGKGLSNALLVTAAHTKAGRPIAVFGPQTGYYMPQLLVEKDVKGPGIEARGVSFAGTDMWVELGHGKGYAWSATSSSADNIDNYVLKLCEPGLGLPSMKSMGYLHNGSCVPIETFQHTQICKPSAGGIPDGPDLILSWRVERTPHYGPLVARGKLTDGTPIAVASKRSTYGRELTSAVGFYRLNDPEIMAGGWKSFREAVSAIDYTFNWFYLDKADAGYQHSCLCPKRSPSVDPYLPAWGTGQWDWDGFISQPEHPFELNPAEGYIVSWNNKQAPGFRANDANFGFGPVYRSEMIEKRIADAIAVAKVDRAGAVIAVAEAATVDLRGQEVLSYALAVMGASAPAGSDPRAQEMRDRIATWIGDEAHRRDHDGDGAYDDPQALAIVDAWWPRLARAIFDAPSGGAIDALGLEIDDHGRKDHIGSAFQGGLYAHVQKDLRSILGEEVKSPWSRIYCGGGDLAACRAALWGAMDAAAKDLEAEMGSQNVADWKRAMAYDEVQYSAVGVTSVPPQPWINRPTFQQVDQILSSQ